MKQEIGYPRAEAAPVANNLEVLFLYIQDYKNLKEIQLNFSGLGFYHLEKVENILRLDYRENKKYPKSLFPIKMNNLVLDNAILSNTANNKLINNVTAIIGENGTGKSNILEYLRRILTNELAVNEESLIILKIDGEIELFHSFDEPLELQDGLNITINEADDNRLFIERQLAEEEGEERNVILELPFLSRSKVVFYSPQADIQSFPFTDSDPEYNDISTNYLLEYDRGRGEEYTRPEFDKILSHKSQTTRRFIDLIYSRLPLPEDINKFIPKSTYVQINRLLSPASGSQNLNIHDQEFIKLFDKKLQENWNIAHALKKERKYIEHSRALLKTELSYSLINHFFHNKEDEYGADSKIDNEKIDWSLPMEDIVRFYLGNQQWKPGEIYNLLYNSLIKAINISKEFSNNSTNSFSFMVDQNIDLVTLYSCYLNYEKLYTDTSHPAGLLDFYWRGISSGEKTLLDLFARLLDTMTRGFVNVGSSDTEPENNIKNVFLLIDEGEIGFHPQWQKNYLKYLIDFLKSAYSNFNIQLILTSHSPFLISDLPRENVIFLQKENENSIVCDPKSLNFTFGGNIHEMLIDSFFLKDGIIGAFAQDKINDVINEILSETPIQPEKIVELKNIIEAIGEPIVRVKLLQMLTEKKLKDSL